MTSDHKALPGLLMPEATLHRLVDQLAVRFAGVFARGTIDRYVFESYTALARTATVTPHLPVLAERFATERLTALAQAKGVIDSDVCEILFVCVHNAGRSQMAAALMATMAETACTSARPVRSRRRGSMPPSSRRWPRSASTSPPSSPSR
jgi:hypothetical protein